MNNNLLKFRILLNLSMGHLRYERKTNPQDKSLHLKNIIGFSLKYEYYSFNFPHGNNPAYRLYYSRTNICQYANNKHAESKLKCAEKFHIRHDSRGFVLI